MPKARKRKTPIVAPSSDAATSSRPEVTRSVIREFHVLLKRQTQLGRSGTKDAATASELDRIQQRIQELGGLERYQHMSATGQKDDRGGGSHKIFIGWMKELGLHKREDKGKLKMLEVGALLPDNYQSCSSWIDCRPIDLNSRHPAILQQDFFLLDPLTNQEKWSAISLSLVLNFVPEPKDRGRMLRMAHSMMVQDGHLFIALPLPCVTNSRYLTIEHFKAIMSIIGFKQLKEKWREGGKMVYYLYQKEEPSPAQDGTLFSKKRELRAGPSRNNFAVLLADA
ncbi:hypothetical protein D9611_004524 [Ephemerocybe angulata]|uniref:25S rRNA adenine-N(1) methyltransferase n=1 Tax=Ephemerocybe angulata TaxID=980116 RepID=A0A8H5BJD0_9AGAR|nr:hypothetical protein D9611_004524 [Tulosesus angulatus]